MTVTPPLAAASATPPRYDPAAPLSIVLNAGSGREDADAACSLITAAVEAAGRKHTIHRIDAPDRHATVVAEAVDAAQRQGGALVAAGGDGTLSSVAAQAVSRGLVFGVLPLGTFNLFARTHGVPPDLPDAARALLRAAPAPVQVGRVGGRTFLVNAALGMYPAMLEDRERFKAEHGRSRLNAKPVPPPLWWISAVCLIVSKMPAIESSTGSTKQAESCCRGRPALPRVGELGRNRSEVRSS